MADAQDKYGGKGPNAKPAFPQPQTLLWAARRREPGETIQ